MDASLAYAFSPKSTNEMVPTSQLALQLEQYMDAHYPGLSRYIFPTLDAMMDWQKANGWWTYFIQGGSPDIGYPMRYFRRDELYR